MERKPLNKLVVGTIDLPQGKVDITDPCYAKDVWCRMNGVKIAGGTYECVVWKQERLSYTDPSQTYSVNGAIGIYLNGDVPDIEDMGYIGEIGVDSGMAGFFQDKPDYPNAEWSEFCDMLGLGRRNHEGVWLTENGFFSLTADGDGGYDVFAMRDKTGIITALLVVFLNYEEDEAETDE